MTKLTIGNIIDDIWAIKQRNKTLEEQKKANDKAIESLEAQLFTRMDEEGMVKATGTVASISIGEDQYPNVKDWDAFYDFVYTNHAGYMLDRRPSVSGCRDFWKAGQEVPGVEPITKRKINMRTV